MVCLQVLGESILERSIDCLRRSGVETISIVMEDTLSYLAPGLASRFVEIRLISKPAEVWLAAKRELAEHAAQGILETLLIRLGAYLEVDLDKFVRFHRDNGQSATRLYDGDDPLDCWLLNLACYKGSQAPADSSPFDPQMAATPCPVHGYVNRLRDARDLRRLVVDAFLSRCSVRPAAPETKPGVWVDDEARVHRRARIVAPAYVGKKARVEADTLITRFSNLEYGCHADYGTVVEDASILANTYLGPCLDVSHAVVEGTTFVDLRRNVVVEIDDASLLARRTSSGSGGFTLRRFMRARLPRRRPGRPPGSPPRGQPVFAWAESNV
jgi:NDP-sugar pyrophosphorylase family protein